MRTPPHRHDAATTAPRTAIPDAVTRPTGPTVTHATEGDRTALSGWPVEKTVYLTLDLECDYGTALDENVYGATDATADLARLLDRHGVPLTCFLQTELLAETPDAVWALSDAVQPVEFHAHSHTHPRRDRADVPTEVRASVEAIRDTFETEPLGFRFPDGAAHEEDYRALAAEGVAFDASLFPSVRPGRFNNLGEPLYPFRHDPTGVVELPFTVYAPHLRVPVALSYLKLLGWPFEQLVTRAPPSVIVFDMHMHDLVAPPAFGALPRRYQAIYARNKHDGFATLDRFIETLLERGYRFDVMTSLYHTVTDALDQPN
ncbi:polysaccharide deacetylase family protein [Haladaptatus sp. DYSN1]|uniref:polysaccharide deacetylase family protein n=1 Tax=unclassified Haladaptatus TaxID=2622732 RepID=UPI0024070F0E|nr:polysaccharide deacetylase family protein [Haladaptatus sp. DYSN1]